MKINIDNPFEILIGVVFSIASLYIIGVISGWKSFSKSNPSPKNKGNKLKTNYFCKVRVNDLLYFGRYRNSVVINIHTEGIELQQMLILRIGHPSIFLKWNEILKVKKESLLNLNSLRISMNNGHLVFDRKTEVNMLVKYINEYTNFKI